MKLQISGYQVIKEAELEIQGITVITGSNNHGKSAIIRAIESCFFSEMGDEFINDHMTSASVRIVFQGDEGFEDLDISWTKQRSTGAVYRINEERYAKERGKPPLEEIEKYGIREITVRDKKQRLFFWRLHDGLFMVVDNPSYVFGFISNLMEQEKVIPVLKTMAKEGDIVKVRLKDMEVKEKIYRDSVTELEGKLSELDNILLYSKSVDMLNQGKDMLIALCRAKERIDSLDFSILDLSKKLRNLFGKIPDKKKIQFVENSLRSHSDLCIYRQKLFEGKIRINNLEKSIKSMKKIKVDKTAIDSIFSKITSVRALQRAKNSITDIDNQIVLVIGSIKDFTLYGANLKRKFTAFKRKIKVCPFCGKKFE
jgi:DNA repair ATPase RecN